MSSRVPIIPREEVKTVRTPSPKACLRLLKAETFFGYLTFATPIWSTFYLLEIGMSFAQVGAANAAYFLVLLFCQVPAGRIADRLSQKWCNVSGNLVAAAAYIGYAQADSFFGVVLAECIVGIGLAFSDGADSALRYDYAKLRALQVDVKIEKFFDSLGCHLAILRRVGRMFAYAVGTLVGLSHPRMAILLVGCALAIAAMFVLLVPDISRNKLSRDQQRKVTVLLVIQIVISEAKAMVQYVADTWKHKRLWWRMCGLAICAQAPNAITLMLITPIMIAANVPTWFIVISWVLYILAEILGALLSRLRIVAKISVVWQFVLIAVVFVCSIAWLMFDINRGSAFVLLGIGLVMGWIDATAEPVIVGALNEKNDIATAMSVYRTLESLIFSVFAVCIGIASSVNISIGIIACVVLFVSSSIVIVYKLRDHDLV